MPEELEAEQGAGRAAGCGGRRGGVGQMLGQTDRQAGTRARGRLVGADAGSWFSGLQYGSGGPVSAFNRMIAELIPRNALLPQVGPQSPVIPHSVLFSDGALL